MSQYLKFLRYIYWEDPDQTAPIEQSDQGLHCLLFNQQFYRYPLIELQGSSILEKS